MNRYLLLFILSAIRFVGSAQSDKYEQIYDQNAHHWVEDTTKDNRFSLKTAPLALIDGYGGTAYNLGAEHKVCKNIAVYVEGGVYFPLFTSGMSGFNIKPQLKYYLNRKGFTSGYFIALQYMYKEQAYNWGDSVFLNPHYYKRFAVSKYVNCIDVLFGATQVLHKNFIFEYFGGVGVRYKNVTTTGITKQELDNVDDDGSFSDYYTRQPGKFTYYDFTAGIKIGYRFN